MKEVKSSVFSYPIGHIRRRVVPTSCAISHAGEPNFFKQNNSDEYTHYRSQFKKTMNYQDTDKQRPASPNRRHKPHPVEVCHLQRVRNGIVCDVRSKEPISSSDKDILGISKSSSSTEWTSWTNSVYKAYDRKDLINQAICNERRHAAIGIVPKCISKCELKGHAANNDHWLPGKYDYI